MQYIAYTCVYVACVCVREEAKSVTEVSEIRASEREDLKRGRGGGGGWGAIPVRE
jgi:hypothetical protein